MGGGDIGGELQLGHTGQKEWHWRVCGDLG